MSIITKQGDSGSTSLMYGRRVSKVHPRIAANGALDELNAVLGVARVHGRTVSGLEDCLGGLQKQLIGLMGEVATSTADQDRYVADGFPVLSDGAVSRLAEAARQLETQLAPQRDWAIPGSTESLSAAHLDHGRTVCRRAEHGLWQVIDSDEGFPHLPAVYLNRLADYLWILARALEQGVPLIAGRGAR